MIARSFHHFQNALVREQTATRQRVQLLKSRLAQLNDEVKDAEVRADLGQRPGGQEKEEKRLGGQEKEDDRLGGQQEEDTDGERRRIRQNADLGAEDFWALIDLREQLEADIRYASTFVGLFS